MYKKPETSLLTAYTKGLEGWADRVVLLQLLEQLMWDLALLAEVLWLGLTRRKLQLMQKQQHHEKHQNHKEYSHKHYNNVGNHFLW